MKKIRFPFALKLGLWIALVATSVSTGIFSYNYVRVKRAVWEQMSLHAADVARLGLFLFSTDARAAIQRIDAHGEKARLPRDEIVKKLPANESADGLPQNVIAEIQAGRDFQDIIQILRKIKFSTSRTVINSTPLSQIPENVEVPSIRFAYVIVPIPESPDRRVFKYIADGDYEELDTNQNGKIDPDEQATPTGMLYNFGEQSGVADAWNGRVGVNSDFAIDKWGTWISAFAPVYGPDRRTIIAVLGVDMDARSPFNTIQELKIQLYVSLAASLVLSMVMGILIARWMNRPLRALRYAARAIEAGDLETQVHIESRDEFNLLGSTFNSMAATIRENTRRIEKLNEVYYQFVPREFLHELGLSDITQIKLGDKTEKEMTVLFADVQAFTTRAEDMSPGAAFDFLQKLFERLAPVIRRHGGFIDKYIGDAIMALFPGDPASAVRAAVDMTKEMSAVNEMIFQDTHRVRMGIGIHTGKTMLGTIGESARMNTTVIADSVNIAARLERLTRKTGSEIIVSRATLEKAGPLPYKQKNLGTMQVKGRRQAVALVEISPDAT